MARYSVANRSTGAGSTSLPVFSLYGNGSVTAKIREIGVFNTTTTACAVCVQRFTTTGTRGSGLTALPFDSTAGAATAAGYQTHTVGPTITSGYLRAATLGAAAGAGVIWTFGDTGLVIPATSNAGVGVVVLTGTGQILDFYIDWDE